MGNQPLPQVTAALYNPDLRDWKMIGEGETYYIWRNGNEEMEEYVLTATDTKEFEYMKQAFQFRHDKEHLVSSKYFREVKKDEICSTFYQGHIYTERIPLRLNEIKDLPYPDNLHLMNSCLLGFRELYEKAGSFTITDHLIGINPEAKVKVWANDDFGKSNPEGGVGARREDERKMVSQIIQVVDKVIDHKTEPESLTGFISQGGTPSFEEALERLTQFTIRHRISIPPILNSIAQLRDLGYFKKIHPKGNTLLQSTNRLSTGLPNIFRGLQPSYQQIPPPISPVSGVIDNTISPINQEIPFPGTENNSPPFPPFNPNALSSMIPPISSYPIQPSNVVTAAPITRTIPINTSRVVRTGINHPVRTISAPKSLPLAKPLPHTTTPLANTYTPRVDIYPQLTSIYDTLTKNQQFKSLPPLPAVPSRIQLIVTKQDGSSNKTTSYIINPQQYPSNFTLSSILYHTTELSNNLEQAYKSNPSSVQRSVRQEYVSSNNNFGSSYNNNNDFGSSYNHHSSGWDQNEGHTDPNLLKGALSIIEKLVDNTSYGSSNNLDSNRRVQDGFTNPSLLQGLKPLTASFSNNNGWQSSNNNNGWGNTNTNDWKDDYKPSQGTDLSFLANMKNFSSSPQPTPYFPQPSTTNNNNTFNNNNNNNHTSNSNSNSDFASLISGIISNNNNSNNNNNSGSGNRKISFL